ncbi:MAG: bifunctional phosphoribosylaminoimidazolecarboxamide formyltransferase/IMP cyclohydrolase, partial [Candidatus Omnitrophota bacterium]
MIKIKRALVSVSDKAGIVELCEVLAKFGVEILSTGGTAKALMEHNIMVKEVSDYTGFPEMLDGRVKTLHPKIHGGLLALRQNTQHMETLKEHKIGLIDMVVVNLYPFEKTIASPGVTREHAIENIDIGGPSMLRSAAKNHQSVVVVCNPNQYHGIIAELNQNNGAISEETARIFGQEVFRTTSHYDQAIFKYLSGQHGEVSHGEKFAPEMSVQFIKMQDLRYGENPHQSAAFYRDAKDIAGVAALKQLWGKELSFNNILDVNAAVNIVKEFEKPAVVFVKHNNPCGVAENDDIMKAFNQSWNCDALSAFGGIVSVNRPIDEKLARAIAGAGFLECIVAPSFDTDALVLLKAKKNVRLLELPQLTTRREQFDFKRVGGGLLVQDEDMLTLDASKLKVVTKKKPAAKDMDALIFAWKVAKHVKSNAIV